MLISIKNIDLRFCNNAAICLCTFTLLQHGNPSSNFRSLGGHLVGFFFSHTRRPYIQIIFTWTNQKHIRWHFKHRFQIAVKIQRKWCKCTDYSTQSSFCVRIWLVKRFMLTSRPIIWAIGCFYWRGGTFLSVTQWAFCCDILLKAGVHKAA